MVQNISGLLRGQCGIDGHRHEVGRKQTVQGEYPPGAIDRHDRHPFSRQHAQTHPGNAQAALNLRLFGYRERLPRGFMAAVLVLGDEFNLVPNIEGMIDDAVHNIA